VSAVRLALPVQWGEMDAYGHVNNVVYFRWFESARIAYFERIGWLQILRERGNGPILHSTTARFRSPLSFPDTVTATARVTELEPDRFTMRYEIRSERRSGALTAEGTGLIVAYDYNALAKARLPEEVVSRIRGLERGILPGGGQ
jgi:acyl-CoA thioester hydrolase